MTQDPNSDIEVAKDVAGKLLGHKKCQVCKKYFPEGKIIKLGSGLGSNVVEWYYCAECDMKRRDDIIEGYKGHEPRWPRWTHDGR